MPPQVCPNCGADVPNRARACPECGACEETGWSDEAHVGGLDLPGEEFDYDEFVQKEFGPKSKLPAGISPMWWITAIILLIVFVAFYILR
jgi:uncharacterized membrane protein YvbJ